MTRKFLFLREILDCASPLALSEARNASQSARGLAQSKTLARWPMSFSTVRRCLEERKIARSPKRWVAGNGADTALGMHWVVLRLRSNFPTQRRGERRDAQSLILSALLGVLCASALRLIWLRLCRVALGVLFLSAVSAHAQLRFAFDYTYDTSGFFADLSRRSVLEAAASAYTTRLTDALAPIVPLGTDTWRANLVRPDLGTSIALPDFRVPQNTVVVFVGGRAFGADILARADLGGASPSGSAAWQSLVGTRGQFGAPLTDFGPWGGSVAFDNSATSQWYFDADPASVADVPASANDFYSVALHELGHLLGVGVAGSWHLQANGNFTGLNSTLAFGGPVPLDADGFHWADGTMSYALDTGRPQEAALDPTLDPGARKFLTGLDLAALRDIGWTAVPEPSTTWLAISGGLVLVCVRYWRRGISRSY